MYRLVVSCMRSSWYGYHVGQYGGVRWNMQRHGYLLHFIFKVKLCSNLVIKTMTFLNDKQLYSIDRIFQCFNLNAFLKHDRYALWLIAIDRNLKQTDQMSITYNGPVTRFETPNLINLTEFFPPCSLYVFLLSAQLYA